MTTNQEGIVPKIHTHTSAEGGIFANAYIIETQNGLVAVDATLTVSESKALKNRIDSINKPLLAILLTHPHPDHVAGVTNLLLGSSSSNNIPIVALESVEKLMRITEEPKRTQLFLQYDIIKTYYTRIGLVMSPNLSKNAYENL